MRQAPTILLMTVGALSGHLARPADLSVAAGYDLVGAILSETQQDRIAAAELLIERGDRSLVPALVDSVFFTSRESRQQVFGVLEALTDESHRDYYDWVEYVGEHVEIVPAPGYLAWKRSLLVRIDPKYQTVLYDGAPARIRLEEIVWGGVPMAGIPALDDPPTIAAKKAQYLRPKERVFGIVVAGEARAYPLRFLSWHELVNDNLGGEAISLSYCTLCGSAIFYRTRTPNGQSYRFDTSGLLYRSNKLMVDRRTKTLWSNLTGVPVVGRLAQTDIELEMLPGTLTTWKAWQEQQPETTVLDLRAIEDRMRPQWTYEYRPGAGERARRGVSFPVWMSSDALERDREVFALRVAGRAKVYPVDAVLRHRVINDEIGDAAIVVIGDPTSGAVRAFRRSSHVFEVGSQGNVRDENGRRWQIRETGLRPLNAEYEQVPLERLPGHRALWFGWYAFFPQTEVWSG